MVPLESVGDSSPELDPDADPLEVAKAICLRMLTARPCSRGEIAKGLARRGVAPNVAQEAIGRLADVGLIDDAEYASSWVRSRQGRRGLARRALAAELRQRGVPDEEARAAVEQITDDVELDTARDLVARKLRTMRGVSHEARVRRLIGMLARKGYSATLAHDVVREALGAGAAPRY
ncbi:MAG: regulatory protein RecX [Mycobacteriales bacterium]|nr:recombination regulator RecX [Frankia sp.]